MRLLLLNDRSRIWPWVRALNTVITGLLCLHQLNAPCRTKLFNFFLLPLFGASGHRLYIPADALSISSRTDQWRNQKTRKAPSFPTSHCCSSVFFWYEAGEESPKIGGRTQHWWYSHSKAIYCSTAISVQMCHWNNQWETNATTLLEKPGVWFSCGVRTESYCQGKQR